MSDLNFLIAIMLLWASPTTAQTLSIEENNYQQETPTQGENQAKNTDGSSVLRIRADGQRRAVTYQRINNRIDHRLQNRVQNRVTRHYNSTEGTIASLKRVESRARTLDSRSQR